MLLHSRNSSRPEESMAKLAWARRWGTGIGLAEVERVGLLSDACGRGVQ
jgi:hypothetical protein